MKRPQGRSAQAIAIRGFPSLDNYGTGMMGLVTLHELARRIPGPLAFHCDFLPETDPAEVRAELGWGDDTEGRIELARLATGHKPSSLRRIARLVSGSEARAFDLVVFLGGDDLSEYYYRNIWRAMLRLWRMNHATPVVLLGQTIGPFEMRVNRAAARHLLSQLKIFPRDKWCTAYLTQELGMAGQVIQSTDLAYADLPLQHRKDLEADILQRFGLNRDGYATMVISALQTRGYYTSDRSAYIGSHIRIAHELLALPSMQGRKLVLLAHTFGRYGSEADMIAAVHAGIAPELRARVVVVQERVLQTRARFLLGNGILTISGRMHPAVSTFQMGRQAITLSYSKKYEGVIGTMLGQGDLIIDANDPADWDSGRLVDRVVGRADQALLERSGREPLIADAIASQKKLLDATFDMLAADVSRPRSQRAA